MAFMRLVFTTFVAVGGLVKAQTGTAEGSGYDVLDYVDQLIGSSNGGLNTDELEENRRLTI